MAERNTARSRYKSATNRVKRTVRNIEKQELRKSLGRWQYLSGHGLTFTTSSSNKGANLFFLPTGKENKRTIYGMDMVWLLELATATNPGATSGCLVTYVTKPGQTVQDYRGANNAMPATLEEGNAEGRFRSFLPFVLSAREGGTAATVVIPFRFFRGHEVVLKPGEGFNMDMLFTNAIPGGTKITYSYSGRYREIVEDVV